MGSEMCIRDRGGIPASTPRCGMVYHDAVRARAKSRPNHIRPSHPRGLGQADPSRPSHPWVRWCKAPYAMAPWAYWSLRSLWGGPAKAGNDREHAAGGAAHGQRADPDPVTYPGYGPVPRPIPPASPWKAGEGCLGQAKSLNSGPEGRLRDTIQGDGAPKGPPSGTPPAEAGPRFELARFDPPPQLQVTTGWLLKDPPRGCQLGGMQTLSRHCLRGVYWALLRCVDSWFPPSFHCPCCASPGVRGSPGVVRGLRALSLIHI